MTKKIINLLFATASIERWNDLPRPVKFIELDKQAHKMIIAYFLAHCEKDVDFYKLINLGIAEVLYRAILTDLKSPVYHYLREKNGEALDKFVLENLDDAIDDELKYYVKVLNTDLSKEKHILLAAGYLASKWEFDIIYNFAPNIYGIEETKRNLENSLEDFYDLEGMKVLSLKKKSYDFISLCGNLRFQKRWAYVPRIPETSVLGHMLFVAIVSFLFTKEYGGNKQKACYNFFTGLFHDLPEALTRDIVAPVKHNVKGLDEILKEYEKKLIEEKILPLVPKNIQKELRILIIDEFANKIITEDGYEIVDFVNKDVVGIDGSLVKIADNFAAFVEALKSIKYGIKAPELKRAVEFWQEKYKNLKLYGIDFSKYFNKDFIE